MQFPIYLTFKQFTDNAPAERRAQPWQVSWNDYLAWTELFSHRTFEMAREQIPAGAPAEGVDGFARTVITEGIMRAHFGDDWFDSVYNEEKSSRTTKAFFYPNAAYEELAELTHHRKEELARRVHQLQYADWFDLVVAKVASGDALSGVAFELDAALYLMNLPMNVEQKPASGEREGKGSDSGRSYDLRFWVSDPPKAVEVKAKRDDTPFTKKTIDSSIKDASEQIPEGESGFVFLRLPPAWVGQGFEDTYADYLGAALRPRAEKSTRSRVSVVFSAVDKISTSPGGRKVVTRVWQPFKSEWCPQDDWKLAMDLKQFQEAGLTAMAPPDPF
ncbi:hypothetical protein A3L23_05152 (plasmid) [Rhodococcoides fascians D188]|nr:hypothetical protein A3L23_05152 [Rhodococcus fascians D188]